MRRLVLLVSLIFVVGSACGPKAKKADTQPVEAPAPRAIPGTAAWSAGALKLPADSPIVLTGKIDRLGGAAVRFKEWLSADPAMFGEDGEAITGQFDVYWSLLVSFFGGEVNDPKIWRRKGIDPDRATHLGFYPIDPEGVALLERADASIRESFGFAPDADLRQALEEHLEADRPVPTGFNSALRREVEEFAPLTGARLVVPVSEASSFRTFFMGVIDALEFREARNPAAATGPQAPTREAARVFTDGGDFPAVRLSIDGSHAIIDVVVAPVDVSTMSSEESPTDAVVQAVERAAQTFAPGRPAAPAPLDDPALSLSFHQPDVARLSRVRGIQRALTTARSLSADDRDAAVFGALTRSERLAENWHGPESGFEGLIYGLDIGAEATNQLAGVTMTMVSGPDRAELPVNTPPIGLGVESRSFGVSLDFDPLFDESWQSWLGVENPRERLSLIADGDTDPLVLALTIPRNLALIAANMGGGDAGDIAPALEEFLASELPNVARAEMAVLSPDLSGLSSAPRYAALFVMDDQSKASEVEVTAQAARDFVVVTTGQLTGKDVDVNALPPLSEGWSKVDVPDLVPHHVEWLPGDAPRLLVVVGLDDESAEAERARLTEEDPDDRDEVVYFFARPAAFVELVSGDNMDQLEPIDAPILAQRLGPIVAWVKPRRTEDASAIHFRFELRRPPRL